MHSIWQYSKYVSFKGEIPHDVEDVDVSHRCRSCESGCPVVSPDSSKHFCLRHILPFSRQQALTAVRRYQGKLMLPNNEKPTYHCDPSILQRQGKARLRVQSSFLDPHCIPPSLTLLGRAKGNHCNDLNPIECRLRQRTREAQRKRGSAQERLRLDKQTSQQEAIPCTVKSGSPDDKSVAECGRT